MIFPNKTLASHSGGKESPKQHIKESPSLERVTVQTNLSYSLLDYLGGGETKEKWRKKLGQT